MATHHANGTWCGGNIWLQVFSPSVYPSRGQNNACNHSNRLHVICMEVRILHKNLHQMRLIEGIDNTIASLQFRVFARVSECDGGRQMERQTDAQTRRRQTLAFTCVGERSHRHTQWVCGGVLELKGFPSFCWRRSLVSLTSLFPGEDSSSPPFLMRKQNRPKNDGSRRVQVDVMKVSRTKDEAPAELLPPLTEQQTSFQCSAGAVCLIWTRTSCTGALCVSGVICISAEMCSWRLLEADNLLHRETSLTASVFPCLHVLTPPWSFQTLNSWTVTSHSTFMEPQNLSSLWMKGLGCLWFYCPWQVLRIETQTMLPIWRCLQTHSDSTCSCGVFLMMEEIFKEN